MKWAPLHRYADTAGDGSGTKQAIGDYSGAVTPFFVAPPAGKIFRVHRMIIHIRDANNWRAERYGNLAAALTNGIAVWRRSTVHPDIELTDGIPIKTNADWARMCYDAETTTYGAGDDYLRVRWSFDKAGRHIELNGTAGDQASIELNDDMTGLVEQTFMLQGYELPGE